VTLPAFAAERRAAAPLLLGARQQSVDISCPPGAQRQTGCRTLLQRSIDGTDRLTDTLPHTMPAMHGRPHVGANGAS